MWIISKLCWFFEKKTERCVTINLLLARKEKKKLAWRQLFGTYCGLIIEKQRVSGRSMLCQSVLKHLCYSNPVMKSVKNTGLWQNVLRTLFYWKCFVSQSFLQAFSLTRNYKSEYLMTGKSWGLNKCIWLLLKIILIINSLSFKHVGSNIYVASLKITDILG